MAVRFDKNGATAWTPGSTVKLATALVCRDWVPDANLNNTVTVVSGDTVDWGTNSNMQLQTGDVLSLRDLLYGLIVASGNDAGKCLARIVGQMILTAESGSGDPTARFITAMNAKATALSMSTAVFTDSYGVDINNRMSAADLVKAMRRYAQDAFLVTIGGVQSRLITITGANARTYTVTSDFDPAGTIAFPESLSCKTGYVTYAPGFETYNTGYCVCLLWQTPSGTKKVSAITGASTSLDRYQDLRRMLDNEIARRG